MKILRPSQKVRRPAVGRHECHWCGAVFELDAEDVAKLSMGQVRSGGGGGDLFGRCPACNEPLMLNPLGAKEPPFTPSS